MKWWLILDGEASGPWNMAKDEHILHRAVDARRPILRLYGWERMTLSVGRGQRLDREVNLGACRAAGVPLVRRCTGGRAVLHGSDLTYAVAGPLMPPFDGGILSIYRELSHAFVHFFEALGRTPSVKAYTGRQRAGMASDICFSTPSAFEILLEGRKIVGSAQRLLPTGFLQHGSLPLLPQYPLLGRLFQGVDEAALREQMTDLQREGVLPSLTLGGLRERLVEAFAAVFGAEFETAPWSHEDDEAVRRLLAGYPLLEEQSVAQHPAQPLPSSGTAKPPAR